jgi:hypothetical protein
VRISTIGFVPVDVGAGGAGDFSSAGAGSSAGGGEPPPHPIVIMSPSAANIHFDRISLLEKDVF